MAAVTADGPLVNALRQRDSALADRAVHLIAQVHPLLDYSRSSFPSGTDHSIIHTSTVEKIASIYLPDELLASLNTFELFFLALACHFHDLGMVGTVSHDADEQGRAQTRREHAITIGERLVKDWQVLGFTDERQAGILGHICRGHRPKKVEGVATWDDLREVEIYATGVSVRIRVVAALIYAIDELHIGADRAPHRVQSWLGIQGDEADRHWTRHRAIEGPVRHSGHVLFQVKAASPRLEEDLRLNVLKKALMAQCDLAQELERNRITARPLPIFIEWVRDDMWHNLYPFAMSDLEERSQERMVQAVHELFSTLTEQQTSLNGLCEEVNSSASDLRRFITDAIRQAVIREFIVKTGTDEDRYLLASTAEASLEQMNRMAALDKLEDLFFERNRERWETKLYRSSYGIEHVKKVVFPAVNRAYSVNLAQLPDGEPVRAVLGRLPYAARVAQTFQPATCTVVKRALLGQAVLTGALFDLHNSPALLLDSELRMALWCLAGDNSEQSRILRLLEELALVSGYTYAQITSFVVPSDAAIREREEDGGTANPDFRMTITQTLPNQSQATSTFMPYLLVAGQRAGQEITMAAEPGFELKVKMEGAKAPFDGSQPVQYIGFGPGAPTLPPSIRLAGRIVVDEAAQLVRIYLTKLSDTEAVKYPFVVRFHGLRSDKSTSRAGGVTTQVRWQLVSAADLMQMRQANELLTTRGARIEFTVEPLNRQLATMVVRPGEGRLFQIGSQKIDLVVSSMTGTLNSPPPLFVPADVLKGVVEKAREDQTAFWHEMRESCASNSKVYTAMILEMANAVDEVVDEEFLEFFSGHVFTAPKVEPPEKQAEVDELWAKGETSAQMSAYYHEDIFTLAEELRKWVDDRKLEFPFKFGSDSPTAPGIRSNLRIIFDPVINCVWHRLRNVRFRFRPVNQKEAYEMEAAYWEHIGDEPRARLAREIIGRNGSDAAAAKQHPQIDTTCEVSESPEHAASAG
jgi:hypothetical protein